MSSAFHLCLFVNRWRYSARLHTVFTFFINSIRSQRDVVVVYPRSYFIVSAFQTDETTTRTASNKNAYGKNKHTIKYERCSTLANDDACILIFD